MTNILDNAFLHIDHLPDDVDLVEALRVFAQRDDVNVPCLWGLTHGSDDTADRENVTLMIGIANTRGALNWNAGDASLVPAHGTNADWVRYQLGGLHDIYVPPGAEVSLETVYGAVEEFLITRQLPTSLTWRAAPSEDT